MAESQGNRRNGRESELHLGAHTYFLLFPMVAVLKAKHGRSCGRLVETWTGLFFRRCYIGLFLLLCKFTYKTYVRFRTDL